jgi:flagellar hook-associated protein 3 FlgL
MSQLMGTYNNYNKLFEQADGNKLHRSSDGSVEYSKYLRYQNSLSNAGQYQTDVSTAMSWMKNTDSALTKVTDLMSTFAEKTINAGNSTNNESDMKDIGKELFSEIQEMVNEMNSSLGERYLFAGQSDMTQPFSLSANKVERGETKTLSEKQLLFFDNAAQTGTELSQFLVLNGDDNNTYYYDTNTGDVYTKDFVENGYKDKINAGQATVDPAVDAFCNIGPMVDRDEKGKIVTSNINKYFSTEGVINDDGESWTATDAGVEFSFSTVKQYVVHYAGDDKKISMVTQMGMTNPKADTVNATGQDVFGSDIFDETSPSGTAMINNLLLVVAKVESGDNEWAGSDGTTITTSADHQALFGQTTIAARYQAYEAASAMLTTQSESLTSDINDVIGADIAKLSTQLVQCQTLYSLALSMGSKIIPGTLADYL